MKAIRRINWHFQSSRIGYRLLRYFFAFSIVPIVFFSLPISAYVLNQSLRNLEAETISRTERFSSEWDLLMEDAFQLGSAVAGNSMVQEVMKRSYTTKLQQYRDEVLLDSELFRMLQHTSENIDIYVFGTNGGRFRSTNKVLHDQELVKENWFREVERRQVVRWLPPRNGSLVVESLDEMHMTLLIPVLPLLGDEISGVVLVDIHGPALDLMGAERDDISMFLMNGEQTVVLEDEIRTVQRPEDLPELVRGSFNKIRYWEPAANPRTSAVIENVRSVTVYRHSTMADWVYGITESKKNAYRNSVMIIGLAVGIVLFLTVLSYLFSYRVSKSFVHPIIELSESITQVRQGDFTARVAPLSNDEIGVLGNDFNEMVTDIRDLMTRIYDEQNRIRQYELMLLQAQINPHFMYNTLESIIWLVRMGETEDSIQMIQALTQFLRTGLSKGKDIINLAQEIDNVTNYLIIQQLRYKRQLSYEIDFPDDLLTQPLPKLILQPLVENAIYHGIKNTDKEGYVHIYGYEQNRETFIVVSDNGAGMDNEKLEALRGGLETSGQDSINSYGFKNVRERLHLFFKDHCTIGIDSSLGEGTTVTIQIHGELRSV